MTDLDVRVHAAFTSDSTVIMDTLSIQTSNLRTTGSSHCSDSGLNSDATGLSSSVSTSDATSDATTPTSSPSASEMPPFFQPATKTPSLDSSVILTPRHVRAIPVFEADGGYTSDTDPEVKLCGAALKTPTGRLRVGSFLERRTKTPRPDFRLSATPLTLKALLEPEVSSALATSPGLVSPAHTSPCTNSSAPSTLVSRPALHRENRPPNLQLPVNVLTPYEVDSSSSDDSPAYESPLPAPRGQTSASPSSSHCSPASTSVCASPHESMHSTSPPLYTFGCPPKPRLGPVSDLGLAPPSPFPGMLSPRATKDVGQRRVSAPASLVRTGLSIPARTCAASSSLSRPRLARKSTLLIGRSITPCATPSPRRLYHGVQSPLLSYGSALSSPRQGHSSADLFSPRYNQMPALKSPQLVSSRVVGTPVGLGFTVSSRAVPVRLHTVSPTDKLLGEREQPAEHAAAGVEKCHFRGWTSAASLTPRTPATDSDADTDDSAFVPSPADVSLEPERGRSRKVNPLSVAYNPYFTLGRESVA